MNMNLLASLSAFTTAYAQSDFFGKVIIFGLIGLSIVCWILLVQKIRITREVRKISAQFAAVCARQKDQFLHLEIDSLPRPKVNGAPHPFGRIYTDLKQKTTEILGKNHYFQKGNGSTPTYLSPADLEAVESFVLTTISTEAKALEKNVFILSTIATLAPFLGLLGTVWGILVTFTELHSGGAAGSNSIILGGLATALSTTVLGLIIAIPALIAYNYLKSTLKTYTSDMEDFLYRLLSTIELQYRKVDP